MWDFNQHILIMRYLVAMEINDEKTYRQLCATNNLDEANLVFDNAVNKDPLDITNVYHKKVWIYDYDKDAKIREYDTEFDNT